MTLLLLLLASGVSALQSTYASERYSRFSLNNMKALFSRNTEFLEQEKKLVEQANALRNQSRQKDLEKFKVNLKLELDLLGRTHKQVYEQSAGHDPIKFSTNELETLYMLRRLSEQHPGQPTAENQKSCALAERFWKQYWSPVTHGKIAQTNMAKETLKRLAFHTTNFKARFERENNTVTRRILNVLYHTALILEELMKKADQELQSKIFNCRKIK